VLVVQSSHNVNLSAQYQQRVGAWAALDDFDSDTLVGGLVDTLANNRETAPSESEPVEKEKHETNTILEE
jgi:hypothetical protein